MQFEMFRLSPKYDYFSSEFLESRIKQLESTPVTKGAKIDLQEKIHQLTCLRQDLRSFRALVVLTGKLQQLKDQAREGIYRPHELHEVWTAIDTSNAKKRMEQRERQRQHFASLRRLWQNADDAKKRQMLKMSAIYSRRRLMIETRNILYAVPYTVARWVTRFIKRRSRFF